MDFNCADFTHVDIYTLIWKTLFDLVRLQITTGGYRTKHGQEIRMEFIEEFVLSAWTC